jgi:hypothetical protein
VLGEPVGCRKAQAMKPRHTFLLDHSVNMALSAIEVYNKPDFKDREQVFSILIVAAWETLLKAKILRDNNNRLSTLYIRSKKGAKSRFKRNRTGHYMTIGLEAAMEACSLLSAVTDNLVHLVDVRDAAVHLTAESKSLPYVTFSLGAAALQNYAALVKKWFGRSLWEYNFYILPLGFAYPFKAVSVADLRKEPDDIAAILKSADATVPTHSAASDGFYFSCEIKTRLISAKKLTDADVTAKIDPSAAGAVIVRRDLDPLQSHPYSWRELLELIKKEVPNAKPRHLTTFLKSNSIKGNKAYSRYHFRNRLEEKRGPSKSTIVLYNDDCLRFAVQEISKTL